jgi:hypothetical protein
MRLIYGHFRQRRHSFVMVFGASACQKAPQEKLMIF